LKTVLLGKTSSVCISVGLRSATDGIKKFEDEKVHELWTLYRIVRLDEGTGNLSEW
jgi:hypothetical protein